jgi:hypothetical protein
MKTVGLLPGKTAGFFWPIKDDLGLKTADIYSIPCKCCKVYTDQTRHSIDTRFKEHHWQIRLYHPDKSAMAEHSIDVGHSIQFQDIRILATKTRHMEHVTREEKKFYTTYYFL